MMNKYSERKRKLLLNQFNYTSLNYRIETGVLNQILKFDSIFLHAHCSRSLAECFDITFVLV